MTLIFSSLRTSTNFFSGSDIVVSRQTDLKPEPINLPIPAGPLTHRSGQYNLAGTAQKSSIFGRTLTMWAGWALIAEMIVKRIVEASGGGLNLVDPEELIASLDIPESMLKQVSLIYHHIDETGHLRRYCFNCDMMPYSNDRELAASGSGVWNFFENIVTDSDFDMSSDEQETGQFLTRIALHSIMEYTSTHSLSYLYGGWFEVAFATELGFDKIPYAIRFWFKSGETLASGMPIFFGWYSAEHLVVSRFKPFEDEEGIKCDVDHFVTRDFLKRSPTAPIPDQIVRPLFVVHVVFLPDFKTQIAHVMMYEDSGMKLEIGPEGMRCAWTNEIRERMFNTVPGGPTMSLSDQVD